PRDGKLHINIIGGNWISPYELSGMVNGVYNSGARWTFVTVVWFTFEQVAPSPPCPDLDGYNDGTYYYYSHGRTRECHAYSAYDLSILDQLASGLQSQGNYLAMGIWSPPTWAGGGPEACPGSANDCAVVLRDHLGIFSDGAKDLSRFLVERYSPGAY